MNANIKPAPQPELTQRQRQILKLLQAGKVNKEVARELDIGVGTVKQHIVALFKKLNVSNRAMAVSRGMTLLQTQEKHGRTLTTDGLLERRPCVVLSIALPEDAPSPAVKLMHGTLAALASAHDALFLARQGHAGDVIFGIQRVTEYDLAIALQTARTVYEDLLVQDAYMAGKMRGCLTAGLAIASMRRFGGWTGEAIASAVISSARELLNETPAGSITFNSAALDLIEILGIGGQRARTATIPLHEINSLYWTGARRTHPLVGRADELATLDAALNEAAKKCGGLIRLEGEMGMGKSRLCEEMAKHCLRLGGIASHHRSLPEVLGKCLYDTEEGTCRTVGEVAALLRAKTIRFPALIIIDDYHLLDREQQALLSAAAADARDAGKLVILSGRRGVGRSSDSSAETIHLRRLSAEAIGALVREALGKSAAKVRASDVQDISSMAAGVPLFAVELARHHDVEQLTLPLLVVINARLDSLSLDRGLLRTAALQPATTSEEIAAELGDDPESARQQTARMVAAGVLSQDGEGHLSFTHPLLRRVVSSLVVE